jgi:hypothetical protein
MSGDMGDKYNTVVRIHLNCIRVRVEYFELIYRKEGKMRIEFTEEPTLAPPQYCMKDQSSNEAAG